MSALLIGWIAQCTLALVGVMTTWAVAEWAILHRKGHLVHREKGGALWQRQKR